MKLERIIGASAVFGSLSFVSCAAPSFNMNNFVSNFRTDSEVIVEDNNEGPALYAFSGLGLGNMMRGNFVKPLSKMAVFSDSVAIELNEWPDYVSRIVDSYKRGEEIILVGHSWGCGDVVNVCNALDGIEVNVDGAIFLDPVFLKGGIHPQPHIKGVENSHLVPDNIEMIYVYNSNGPFNGREFRESDFKNPDTLERVVHKRLDDNHWNMTLVKKYGVYLKNIKEAYLSGND